MISNITNEFNEEDYFNSIDNNNITKFINEEDILNLNNNKNNSNIIYRLRNKLLSNPIFGRAIKNKTKRRQKSEIPLNKTIEYQLNTPNVLFNEFSFITTTNNKKLVSCCLYAILNSSSEIYEHSLLKEIKFGNDIKSFGIITPNFIGDFPNCKMINSTCSKLENYNIESISIRYIKNYEIKEKKFELLLTFYQRLCLDLYGIKYRKQELLHTNLDNLFINKINERKYFIVPIIEIEGGSWEIVIITN